MEKTRIVIVVAAVVSNFSSKHLNAPTPAVDRTLRARLNPELNRVRFGAGMSVINNIMMLAIILTGAVLVRECERVWQQFPALFAIAAVLFLLSPGASNVAEMISGKQIADRRI